MSKTKIKNKSRGFTLVEMLVSLAIFATVITLVSTIFVSGIRAQRQNLAYQQLLDQTSYLIEYMSRAIRMAIKDDIYVIIEGNSVKNDCLSGDRVNYEFDGQCLKFRNYKNECQQFCLEGTKIVEKKGSSSIDLTSIDLTSPDLTVSSFSVIDPIVGGSWKQPPDDSFQPLVTIYLEIEGKERAKIEIKTSVSQRNLDVKY